MQETNSAMGRKMYTPCVVGIYPLLSLYLLEYPKLIESIDHISPSRRGRGIRRPGMKLWAAGGQQEPGDVQMEK